jgi:hypothetical protein
VAGYDFEFTDYVLTKAQNLKQLKTVIKGEISIRESSDISIEFNTFIEVSEHEYNFLKSILF